MKRKQIYRCEKLSNSHWRRLISDKSRHAEKSKTSINVENNVRLLIVQLLRKCPHHPTKNKLSQKNISVKLLLNFVIFIINKIQCFPEVSLVILC
jgi:hypothetical protein